MISYRTTKIYGIWNLGTLACFGLRDLAVMPLRKSRSLCCGIWRCGIFRFLSLGFRLELGGLVHVGSGRGFLLNLDLSRLWPLKYRGDDEFLNFTIFTELWTEHSVLCWIDQWHWLCRCLALEWSFFPWDQVPSISSSQYVLQSYSLFQGYCIYPDWVHDCSSSMLTK